MALPNALVQAVRDRQAVLFAGAGISVTSLGWAGSRLRDIVGQKIQLDYPDYDYNTRSLEDVCDEYATLNDRPGLVNVLADAFPAAAPPSAAHLAAVKCFRFIVTTNWDTLFEEAYRQINQKYQLLATNSDAPNFNYDQHNLIKIHGSCDRPLTLISTTDDYENYPDTHADLIERVAELLQNNTVLFVGYGLRDEHVRRLLAKIRARRGVWTKKAYAIGFYDTVRTKVLDLRKIQTIPEPADKALPELAQAAGY